MDLIFSRYHTLDFMKDIRLITFCEMVLLAIDHKRKENVRQEWLALLPLLLQNGKAITFEQYYDMVSGKNIDMRPNDVIISEIDKALNEAFGERKNGDGNI